MVKDKGKKGAHNTKPARLALLKLCQNPAFKEKVKQIRQEWHITTLATSPDDNSFWKDLCEADKEEHDSFIKQHIEDEYDEKQSKHQRFQLALEQLSKDSAFGLPCGPDWWATLYAIVLWLDLDNEEDILALKAPTSMFHVLFKEMDGRLYLDVTFATRDDIPEIWKWVNSWQEERRPELIKSGKLLDISGRPGHPLVLTDEICREVARLKDEEKLSSKEIIKRFGFKTQEGTYQSSTYQKALRRGRALRKQDKN